MWTKYLRTWTGRMASRAESSAIRAWDLEQDQTVRFTPGRGGVALRAQRGCLLVTQEGDPEDHVLVPGEELRLSGRGLAVAWALSPSSVAVAHGASSTGMARRAGTDYSPSCVSTAPAKACASGPTR